MANDIAKAYVQIVPSAEGIGASLTSVVGTAATSAGLSAGTALGTGLLSNMKGMLIGGGIAAVVGLVVNALKACVSEASEFDASMSQVAATMGTTTDEISELSEFAKEMGRTTAFSANEAAQGLNTLALAGLDADEQMAVLPSVMNLASAGCLDLDDAASYVTGTIKGFGDSMDNAEHYADLMAKGATLANTDVNDLGEAMSGAAATANSYGQEAESVTVSLLRLAEQNVTGSEAATAMNRAMADLYTPTSAAKGALDELGVSCYDEAGAARDFNDVVDELNDALAGMSEQEQNTYKDTIFTTRGLQAFNKMTVSSKDTVQEFKDELADCSGSAMQQAETQLDNLQGDVTLFKSAMSGLKIEIGEALTPMLRGITQFATSAITGFTNMISGQGQWKENFVQCVDNVVEKMGLTDWPGLGELVEEGIGGGFRGLVQSAPAIMSEVVQCVRQKFEETDWHEVGYNVASKIIGGLGNIMSEIPGAISSITQNIVQFLKDVDWHQVGYDLMTAVLNGIKTIVVDVPQAIVQFTQSIIQKIRETNWLELGKEIIQGIINGITNIVPEALSSVGSFCKGLWDAFTDFFQTGSPSRLMQGLGEDIVTGMSDGMNGMSDSVTEPYAATVEATNQFSADMTNAMATATSGVVSSVDSSYGQIPTHVSNPLTNALSNVIGWGANVVSNVASSASQTVSNIGAGYNQVPNTINSPLTTAQGNVQKWGAQMQTNGGNIARNFVTAVSNGMQNLSNKIQTYLTQALNAVTKWGTSMTQQATSIAQSFVSNFSSGMSGLSSAVSSACSSAVSTASSYSSSMSSAGYSVGSALVQGMINGVNSGSGSLYSTISSVVSTAVSKANAAAGTGSPSRYLAWTGRMMDEGLALGLSNYAYMVDNAMDDVMSIVGTANDNLSYSATANGTAGNPARGNVINITQNIYSEAKTAAQLMREARHQAQRAVIQGV